MKYLLIIFLAFTIIPAFGQEPMIGDYLEPSNPSLIIQQTEIPYSEFNKVKGDVVIAFADTTPDDTVLGQEIFKVVHQKSKSEIYVSLEDLEEK